MIGYVKGILEEVRPDCVILDRDGIGFRIFVPTSLLQGAFSRGQEVKLYTYLSVKEDSLSLYGFAKKEDLEAFKLLIGVNGIGPKAALGVLSVLSAEELRYAVLTEDTRQLSKAPGIGKKTAAKVILELKDAFKLEDLLPPGEEEPSAAADHAGSDNAAVSEAAAALVALGYGRAEAMKAVRDALAETGSSETGALLKAALKHLF